MTLPIPQTDPLIEVEVPDDFFDSTVEEDKNLLQTGKWDDVAPDGDEPEETDEE